MLFVICSWWQLLQEKILNAYIMENFKENKIEIPQKVLN